MYKAKWGEERLSMRAGPQRGFVANFLSLACSSDINTDFFAFSDQDDIWEKDKLSRAIKWLGAVSPETPALYATRTRLIDDDDNEIGLSALFKKPPSFSNALVQSISGGNTLVFNAAACELVRLAGSDVNIVSHDWWLYLLVTGCGGRVYYDPEPSLRYRQHAENLVGANTGLKANVFRARKLIAGQLRKFSAEHIHAFSRIRSRLTPESAQILSEFTQARDKKLPQRILGFSRSGIYRQTWLGNIGLIAAVLMKKI